MGYEFLNRNYKHAFLFVCANGNMYECLFVLRLNKKGILFCMVSSFG